MRILQIGTFPYPSPQGSQVYVRGIVRGLAALGHQVDLLCYGHGIGSTEVETAFGVQIWRTTSVKGYHNMRAGPDTMKPILDLLMAFKMRHCKPDIIHVHNYEAPLVTWLAQGLFKHLKGIPVVYSAHNTMADELPTYLSHPVQKRLGRYLGRFLDQTVPKRMSHTIVLRRESETQLRTLGCQYVSTVSPGIDPTEFLSPQQLQPLIPPEMSDGRWIVYAGNPDVYQDLPILIEALDRLPDVHFVFVSAADASGWQRKNGRTVHIRTSDFQKVQAIVSAADLAVIPRQQCTGFPIKLLNYLALGTKTICAEGSSVPIEGVSIVPNGDIDSLVSEIRRCLADDQIISRDARRARTSVLNEYTWQAQAQKLTAIYRSLLD